MKIEPIDKVLSAAGIELVFDSFKILGLIGFDNKILSRGVDSIYEAEIQDFKFQISTKDVLDKGIIGLMNFTLVENKTRYEFSIKASPISDLTGWSSISCDLLRKVPIDV